VRSWSACFLDDDGAGDTIVHGLTIVRDEVLKEAEAEF